MDERKTSTPLRKSRAGLPSISSVSSIGGNSDEYEASEVSAPRVFIGGKVITRRSTTSSEASAGSSNGHPESFIAASLDFSRISGIKITRGSWGRYKPVRQDGLYFSIYETPTRVEHLAKEWFALFETNPDEAFTNFIQFFIDVSSNQHVILDQFFDLSKDNFNTINEYFLDHLTEFLKKGNYLLRHSSNKSIRQVHDLILSFVTHIISLDVNANILLYNQNSRNSFVRFLKEMSKSQLRSVCHTAVVFSLKVTTGYSRHLITISQKMRDYLTQAYQHAIKVVADCLNNLNIIFEDNYLDSDTVQFRKCEKCASEMWQWFSILPERFLTDTKYMQNLFELLKHESPLVRWTALGVCCNLINEPELSKYLDVHKAGMTLAIFAKTDDVDHKTALKATQILTTLTTRYPGILRQPYMLVIFTRMFGNDYPRANAAAEFFLRSLNSNQDPMDYGYLLKSCSRLADIPAFIGLTPLLVESLIEHLRDQVRWGPLIQLLLGENGDDSEQEYFVNFICEFISQLITGKASLRRANWRQGKLDKNDQKTILSILLPNFKNFLDRFDSNPKCVSQIINLIPLFEYKLVSVEFTRQGLFKDVFAKMENLFRLSNNVELAEAIVKCFSFFFKKVANKTIMPLIQVIATNCYDMFEEFVKNPVSQDSDANFVKIWVQMQALFSNFDITSYVEWPIIFNSNHLTNAPCLKHQMACCNWYIIWELHAIINDTHSTGYQAIDDKLKLIHEKFTQYVTVFSPLLTKKKGEIPFIVLQSFIHLLSGITDEMEKNKDRLKSVIFIEGAEYGEKMMVAFDQWIMNSHRYNKNIQVECLGDIIKLIFKGTLSQEELPKIFKYYYSHRETFERALSCYMGQIKNNDELLHRILIFDTMYKRYQEISVQLEGNFSTEFEDAQELVKLGEQFCRLQIKINEEACELLMFCIRMQDGDGKKLQFLHFMECFIRRLSGENKKVVLDQLMEHVPRDQHENPYFMSIICQLRSEKKVPKTPTKRRLSTTSVGTSSVTTIGRSSYDDESMIIEEVESDD